MHPKKPSPSRFTLWLFRKFCKPELHPYLEGDLLQHFAEKVNKLGPKRARRHLVKDVILLFRPGIIRSPKVNQKLNTSMFKHYLLISLRSFRKDKLSFIINLAGMIVGLTAVLLIYLWINQELKMDRFHKDSDRLYQVMLNEPSPNGINTDPSTQVLLAPTLINEFPEVDQAVSVVPYDWFEGEQFIVSDGGERIFTSRNQFASKGFFELFSFPLLEGNPENVLDDPRSVVISESLALKLFKTPQAIGKRLDWLHPYYGGSYQVSGVFKDLQGNSSQQFDAVFSFEVMKADEGEEWQRWSESDPYTYLKLQAGTDFDQFQIKLGGLVRSKGQQLKSSLFAQRYADTYLFDRYENGKPVAGRIQYVRLFAVIALLILTVACLNFMIMATAKAGFRMKEVGVKKAMGAERRHLINQFFTESFLVTVLAFAGSLGLANLVLPLFSQVVGRNLNFEMQMQEWLMLAAVALLTAVFSGIYPALHLSGFKPVAALKGKVHLGGKGHFTRKSFVIAQFTVSTVLIIASLVVSAQIDHIQSKNLGFDKERLIWFTMGKPVGGEGLSEQSISGFLNRLKAVPGVESSTNFAHNVLGAYGTTTGLNWPGQESDMLIAQISGGHNLISTLGIEMAEGRAFSSQFLTDMQGIVLNETAIAQMGLKNPVGKRVQLWGQPREIIGICKDFHIDQLYHEIMPVFIKLDLDDFAPHVLVRLAPGDPKAALEQIESAFNEHFVKGYPFEPHYLEDDYKAFYQQEIRVGHLANYATAIAIFIACLGIFAFSGLTLQRRLKELAIRKVLGSGLNQLAAQVMTGFVQIVLLSSIIAIPVAIMVSKSWLDTFTYRVDLNGWLVISALALMFLFMLLAVSYHSVKAIRVNVLKHLKQQD